MKLYIPRTTYQKIMHWVNHTNKEVGGMATVKYNKENNYFWVTEAYLLDQEVTAAATDLDAEALGKLELEILGTDVGELNLWWHSHVQMSCFWSGTDKETILKYGGNGYMLATVFNQKNELRSALAYKSVTPFGGERVEFIDDITTIIYDPVTEEQTKLWDEEFALKVREFTYTRPIYYGHREEGAYDYTWNHDMSISHVKELRRAMHKKITLGEMRAKVNKNTAMGVEAIYTYQECFEAGLLGLDTYTYVEGAINLNQKELSRLDSILEERTEMYSNGK